MASPKVASLMFLESSQSESFMLLHCHQFGDPSSPPVTNLDAFHRHRSGDTLTYMKGKYPNGLQAAMDQLKIGPTELARAAKTSKQNVDRWAKGERELTAYWAEKLGPPLKTAPEQLVFPNSKNISSVVPLLSWVSAGKLAEVDTVVNIDSKRHISVAALPAGDWIALEVRGDSMDRVAADGSLILVNRLDDRLKDEAFYVFATTDTGDATFKRYRAGTRSNGRLQPFSTNPDHETIPITEAMKCIGRVRRVITDLK